MSKVSESELNKKLTDQQILKMDFYDFCGSASVFMTDQEKLDYWKKKKSEIKKKYKVK